MFETLVEFLPETKWRKKLKDKTRRDLLRETIDGSGGVKRMNYENETSGG